MLALLVGITLGGFMKNLTFNQNKVFRIFTVLFLLTLLTSCGTSKSNPTNNTSPSPTVNGIKPLANCQKTVTADASINMAAVVDQAGTPDLNWTKLKFNYLSTAATASGNQIRFFKWRMMSNGTSYLEPTALYAMFYDLSTGQPVSSSMNVIPTGSIIPQRGLYIQLNDSTGQYQVLKIVVYDKDNNLVGQMNALIPQFLANPADYAYNTDGTARAQILQSLHPLSADKINTAGWTSEQYLAQIQTMCF